jgi:hypothetical protein
MGPSEPEEAVSVVVSTADVLVNSGVPLHAVELLPEYTLKVTVPVGELPPDKVAVSEKVLPAVMSPLDGLN